MTHHRYTVHESAPPADLAAVDAGIGAFNRRQHELDRVRPLAVFARDGGGAVAGGAVGRSWGECCELQQLWVRDAERGHGVGRQLMTLFEHEAARRGCRLVYLDSFSFQAPDFYRKLGYAVVLETRGFTGGIVRFTLHKALGDAG